MDIDAKLRPLYLLKILKEQTDESISFRFRDVHLFGFFYMGILTDQSLFFR